jgi:hypothetical protein
MTVLLVLLALVLLAALVLAVELLRPEPVSEQGLADLNQALMSGQDYEPLVRLFVDRDACPDAAARTPQNRGRAMRMHLNRLRGDFLTAWAVCRLLAPICQEPNPMRRLFRYWLSFHWLFVGVWITTYSGQSAQAADRVRRLVTAFGDLRQWASALMQSDTGLGVGAGRARRIRI